MLLTPNAIKRVLTPETVDTFSGLQGRCCWRAGPETAGSTLFSIKLLFDFSVENLIIHGEAP